MGIKYDWKNLELISLTSVTNVLTFIQFALVPLSKANVRQTGTNFSLINFLGLEKLLLKPIEYIKQFQAINPPMRCLLSATIIICFINLMTLSFFFPTYKLYIFLCDLFLPGMCMMSILWSNYGYQPSGLKVNAPFIIIGILWMIGRLAVYIYFKWHDIFHRNWYKRMARLLTAIFLERLKLAQKKKNVDEEHLKQMDEDMERMRQIVIQREPGIDYRYYPKWRKIFDIALAGVSIIIFLILTLIWKKVVMGGENANKTNREAVATCLIVTTAVILVFFIIRLLLALLYFFDKTAPMLVGLRRLAFKGIIMLSSLVIIPVCNLILNATDLTDQKCPYKQYWDYKVEASTFIQFFTRRDGAGCANCSRRSYEWQPCVRVCVQLANEKANRDGGYLSEFEIAKCYTIPMIFVQMLFLFIMIQVHNHLFKKHRNFIELLPAPTTDIEAKFTSVVDRIKSSGAYQFTSYSHQHSLFNFDFTQFKAFVLFAASTFPIFPAAVVQQQEAVIITIIFVIVCAGISFYMLFRTPFKSPLHNILNIADYALGTFTSVVAVVSAAKGYVSPIIGTISYFAVIIVPFVLIFTLPFFLKFDPSMRPTKYKLKDIMRKQRKIRAAKKARRNKQNRDLSESGEESSGREDPDFAITDFDTIALSPTYTQEGRNKRQKLYDSKLKKVWTKVTIVEGDFAKVTNEMFEIADNYLDVESFVSVTRFLSFATVYCALCLGYGVGAGVAFWQKDLLLTNEYNPYCGVNFKDYEHKGITPGQWGNLQ